MRAGNGFLTGEAASTAPPSSAGHDRDRTSRFTNDMTALRDQLQRTLSDQYVLDREIGRGGMASVYLT